MLMRLLLFLGHEQVHRNNAAEPERPPNDTASVANNLGYLLGPCNVSTVLINLPRTSLSHLFTLYRALVAGPWLVMAAVRH